MKNLILTTAILLTCLATAQSRKCIKGDCLNTNSFVSLSDASGQNIGYEAGFFKDGKLHGLGNQTGVNGKFWGTYENGKKNGLFRYSYGDILYALGHFIDDKKVGIHIVRTNTEYKYPNYDYSPLRYEVMPVNPGGACAQGDCENGMGVKILGEDAISGFWKDGKSTGMTIIYSASQQKILMGTMENGLWDGVVCVANFDGTDEIYITQMNKKEGNYLKRLKNGQHLYQRYVSNSVVETYPNIKSN
jgi:hypothetical protein